MTDHMGTVAAFIDFILQPTSVNKDRRRHSNSEHVFDVAYVINRGRKEPGPADPEFTLSSDLLIFPTVSVNVVYSPRTTSSPPVYIP